MTESTIGIDRDRDADLPARGARPSTQLPHRAPRRRRGARGDRRGSSRRSRSAAGPSAGPRCAPRTRAVIAATATGAPGRIDDETRGLPLHVATPQARRAGTLLPAARLLHLQARATPRSTPSTTSSARRARRSTAAAATPAPTSPGGRALLTGGRAKIGMYIALRLLRDGAHTTITTRFPKDAARRFARCRTAPTGCTGCGSSASTCATRRRSSRSPTRSPPQGPLDILINNAAQTVRRSPGAYARARRGRVGAAAGRPAAGVLTFGHTSDAHPQALTARGRPPALTAHALTSLALTAGSAVAAADRRRHRDRRRRPGARPAPRQQLDPARRRGRPGRAARGPALQQHRAVHPHQPAARGAGGLAGAAHLRRQRLGDGGPVQPRLQGPRPPAHEHGQGRAEHADPHQRRGDARPTASS